MVNVINKLFKMIFSQSLHDVVYEASASLSSSTEKVPLEHVGGDIDTASSLNAPDPSLTDSFPRVFRYIFIIDYLQFD